MISLQKILEIVQESHQNAHIPSDVLSEDLIYKKIFPTFSLENHSFDTFFKGDLKHAPMVLVKYSKDKGDDVFYLEKIIAKRLANHGYMVVGAHDVKSAFKYLQENAIEMNLNYKTDAPDIKLAAVVDIEGLDFFKNQAMLDVNDPPPTQAAFWFLEPWFTLVMVKCDEFIYKHLEEEH